MVGILSFIYLTMVFYTLAFIEQLMKNLKELTNLARKVDKILKEELDKDNIKYALAEARIYDIKCVGIQGDKRTYAYPAEITLFSEGKFVWTPDFIARLSSRITNEVKGVNRVVYVLASKN